MSATYTRLVHAAHYGSGGHDLEQWDCTDGIRRGPHGNQIPPADVPQNAEYHSGYIDRDGVPHYVFVRRATFSAGTCPRCAP